jgi:hypothetical protein
VPCICDRSKEFLSITINFSLFLQMPYRKTPHILYRIHIWSTTRPVEDVYILILEPCCYPVRRMHGAVVLLKEKVLIGINPSTEGRITCSRILI